MFSQVGFSRGSRRAIMALILWIALGWPMPRARGVLRYPKDPRGQEDKTHKVAEQLRPTIAKLHYTSLRVFGGCGVVLSDQHILTARHAVRGWKSTSLGVVVGDQYFAAKSFVFPSDRAVDLAIIKLEKPIVPLPGQVMLLADKPARGDRVWLGGYGLSGSVDDLRLPGAFASGFNRISRLGTHTAGVRFDAPGHADAEPGEALPGIMDSGSPVFLQGKPSQAGDQEVSGASRWLLSGITVTVTNAREPRYGSVGKHELAAASRRWIDSVVPGLRWVARRDAQPIVGSR